ncbi:MAG: hypothetical protein KGJ77_03550 [Acidobacteriota bacterium]|nr:hypothetical protein [Acidobacteriota bacterium]
MTGRRVFRRRRRAAGVLSAVALSVLSLSACAAPRDTLGTKSSACFRAVPVATDAVRDRGTLSGVRLLGSKDLDRRPRFRSLLEARAGRTVTSVCVVSFQGRFRLDQVQKSFGRAPASGTGTVALVFVSSPEERLLGTLVLSRVPLPLRHEVLRWPPLRPQDVTAGRPGPPAPWPAPPRPT